MRPTLKLVAIALLGLIAGGLVASRFIGPAPQQPEVQGLIGSHIGPRVGPHIGPTAGSSGVLVVALGDSNTVGQMDIGKADSQFAVSTPSGPLFDAFYGSASNEPVTMTHFGPTTLTAYGVAPGAGFELTLGRTLLVDVGQRHVLAKIAISGTRAVDWDPSATYGTSSPQIGGGANLFNATVARVRSLTGSTGSSAVHFVINLGTNDAVNGSDAAAMSAHMTAINNGLRAAFPGCKIVWVETHSSTTNTFTSTVRTQQESYAATAGSWFALINIDYGVLLGDGLHYDANTYLDVGVEAAFALGDLLGIARRSVSITPAMLGYGTAVVGTGAIAARPWQGSQVGDLVYAYAQVAAVGTVTGTPSDWTPSNWTLTKSGNTASSGVNVQFALFERKLAAGDFTSAAAGRPARPNAVSFVTPGPESSVALFTWRGASATNASQETVLNTFGQGPSTITGLTTSVDHCSIAWFGAGWAGSPLGDDVTLTPPGTVTNVIEVHDAAYQHADTAAHAITLTTAELAAHGVLAAASRTNTPNQVGTAITAAVAP